MAAARDLNLDFPNSAMFGDRASDLEAAQTAGVLHRFLLGTDGKQAPDTMLIAPGLVRLAFEICLRPRFPLK